MNLSLEKPNRTRRIFTALVAMLAIGFSFVAHPQSAPANLLRVEEQWRLDDLAARIPETASPIVALDLSVVVLEETDWRRGVVEGVVTAAGRILAQCGVRLRRVSFQRITVPQRYRMLYNPASRELAAALHPKRPTVYFVQDTLNQPEFDAEAFGRANSKTRPELTDSVWITTKVTDAANALAHELAHVLMDDGAHSTEPNNLLRAEPSPTSTRLNASQCARMIATGVANDLLIELPRPNWRRPEQ